MQNWLENAMLWLVHEFGKEKVLSRQILRPHYSDISIRFDGSETSAYQTLELLAKQMEIDKNELELSFYSSNIQEFKNDLGGSLFTNLEEGESTAGGLYFGRQENGKYHISLENSKLNEGETIISTLSHELAHVKLLGEGRIEKNNEPLTDLTTIVFGLGIFRANTAFRYKKSYKSWSYSKSGYLTQMDWGYALAVFAYLRQENENAEWVKFLSPNVKADLKISLRFIDENDEVKAKLQVWL